MRGVDTGARPDPPMANDSTRLAASKIMAASVSTQPKITIRNLTKRFFVSGTAIEALAGVDLDIRAGEFFCTRL